ncbi:MAG: hypothetical protein ABI327_10170 [Burkholderiaceae bacterium]
MPAVIAALIGWRMYRRVRRLIGRQPVRVKRLTLTAIFFPILLVLVGLSGLRDIALLEGVVAGAAIGVALAWFGLRLTRFETTADGYYFIPNATIGVAISILFIGRLIYRFGVLYFSNGKVDPATMQSFGSSPLTLAIFGVVAAYYTAFAIGVLLWYRKASTEGGPVFLPIRPER